MTATAEQEALAQEVSSFLDDIRYDIRTEHGFEVMPGFFNIRNMETGQSKTVLYHPESGYIFKAHYYEPDTKTCPSGKVIGEVTWDGRTYPVRLPEYAVVKISDERYISIEEYVGGANCGCESCWCDHASDVKRATKCADAHTGNWKIQGNEVILFDFESIAR